MQPKLLRKPSSPNAPKSRAPDVKSWQFSLKYWKQVENFGVGEQNAQWFISVLNRLHEMCKMTVEEFKQSSSLRDQFHYHELVWTSAPIDRAEFNWVDANIIENPEEFPFFQFSISAGTGRVVGVFDGVTFYILLLDPMHNIYLTHHSNYKVSPTTVGKCQFTQLVEKTEQIVSYAVGNGFTFPTHILDGDIASLPAVYGNVLIVRICDATVQNINELVVGGVLESSGEFVREAIVSYAKAVADLT